MKDLWTGAASSGTRAPFCTGERKTKYSTKYSKCRRKGEQGRAQLKAGRAMAQPDQGAEVFTTLRSCCVTNTTHLLKPCPRPVSVTFNEDRNQKEGRHLPQITNGGYVTPNCFRLATRYLVPTLQLALGRARSEGSIKEAREGARARQQTAAETEPWPGSCCDPRQPPAAFTFLPRQPLRLQPVVMVQPNVPSLNLFAFI